MSTNLQTLIICVSTVLPTCVPHCRIPFHSPSCHYFCCCCWCWQCAFPLNYWQCIRLALCNSTLLPLASLKALRSPPLRFKMTSQRQVWADKLAGLKRGSSFLMPTLSFPLLYEMNLIFTASGTERCAARLTWRGLWPGYALAMVWLALGRLFGIGPARDG